MVGEWILLKRPTAFVGPKIQTSWPGPYQNIDKVGEHSVMIQVTSKSTQEVHTSRIKIVSPTPPPKVCIQLYSNGGINVCLLQQEWIGICCNRKEEKW